MNSQIQQAAMALISARSSVALTGAGISVESGIPPFRGKGGLWEQIDPMKYAHIDAYERNPAEVWEVLFMRLRDVLEKAEPNDGHLGLYRLETMGLLQCIVTQNVDGLHQQAGSKDVIEFHGTFASHHCTTCGQSVGWHHVNLAHLPPKCPCGGILRPDVVMFGEIIPMDRLQRAQMLASTCDVMMVVGTSATVEPAAYLPFIAKRAGATIIEINPEPTPLTRQVSDITLLGKAGRIMRELLEAVKQIRND
ncbi:MAG: NAD-dependent deacylase [Desulfobacteraceae bacterium]|jgi:NAD-dependent deacetylase